MNVMGIEVVGSISVFLLVMVLLPIIIMIGTTMHVVVSGAWCSDGWDNHNGTCVPHHPTMQDTYASPASFGPYLDNVNDYIATARCSFLSRILRLSLLLCSHTIARV